MVDKEELARRKKLTFEQAEGLVELPRQLLPNELPNTLRARLLNVIVMFVEREMNHRSIRLRSMGPHWTRVFKRFHAEHLGKVTATFDNNKVNNLKIIETIFAQGQAMDVYGVLQAIVRLAEDDDFSIRIASALVLERSAYRLVDGDTLIPFGSSEEAAVLQRALIDTKESGLMGAHKHLKGAAKELSVGNFADSVRESVHTVESVLRSVTKEPSVSKALTELSKRRPIHEALKKGVMQLYGYGSDEPGIRHPLLVNGDVAVTEEDAMLMLGMCAAITTYFSRTFREK